MQSRHLRHARYTAQSSTLIGSALADIVMGRTVTNPLGGMACIWCRCTPEIFGHIPHGRVLPDEGCGCLIPVSAPKREQSEMPNWMFFSEVPAARGPSFEDSAETEQSNWLEERSNPSLWQAGFRGHSIGKACPFGEFSKKKGNRVR
ncbi:hypothetical protein NKJ46_14735 [Mesorhizobium sp. M0166]|uniref:hypothetical protein n=1 Tax=unclassified Mesorhizobium TaxID=325217 RepID=UPI003338F22E